MSTFTLPRFVAGLVLIAGATIILNINAGWIAGIIISTIMWLVYNFILDL